MSIEYNNRINGKNISKEEFSKKLAYADDDTKAKAIKIFDYYANLNGNADILDESEQVMARAAFQALDINENGEVSKKEIKKGKKGSETQQKFAENGYAASKEFIDAISGDENSAGTIQYGKPNENDETEVTVHNDKSTPTTDDDTVTTYHLDKGHRVIRKDEIEEKETKIYTGTENNSYQIDNTPDATTHGLPAELPQNNLPQGDDDTTPQGDNNGNPVSPTPPTVDEIKQGFFQYVTQDKDFNGTLKNGSNLELPTGCTLENGGIKFNDKLYVMRGALGNNDDPLRFECDDTKQTLRQALSAASSDDDVHKYHNHGDNINSKSTYNATEGEITHGDDERAVSQTQTFASMLMNGAVDSTLQLDEQKGNPKYTTTGETILNTINTDSDNGISMQELISYLNAVQKESQSVQNRTGARKFAGGVDLDLKDLSNIGKVFKKYAGSDGKLQASELQQLLDALKQQSMSQLATDTDDKYIGAKTTPVIPPRKPDTEPTDKPILRDGNRTRKVKHNGSEAGYGKKEEYYYKDGVRTALKKGTVESVQGRKVEVTVEDENGNVAQAGHSSLFKKRFIYVEGLPKEVRAKVVEGNVDGNKKDIIRVEDKNGNETYYTLEEKQDKSYKTGEKLTKKKDKFLTPKEVKSELTKALNLPDDIEIPKNITVEYDKKGNMKLKLNGGECSQSTAKVYILRHNTQKGKVIDNQYKTEPKPADNTQQAVAKPSSPKDSQKQDRYDFVELTNDEKTKAQAKASEKGLRVTEATNYGWYYSDKEKTHYYWDKTKQDFIKDENVRQVWGNQTFNFNKITNDVISSAQKENKAVLNSLANDTKNISTNIKRINAGKQTKKYFELMFATNPKNVQKDVIQLLTLARYNKLESDSNYKELLQFKKEHIDNDNYKKLKTTDLKELDNIASALNDKIKETDLSKLKLSEDEKTQIKAKANEQNLQSTWAEEYGWYMDSKKQHYYWDRTTQTFILEPGISIIFSDGDIDIL